MESAAGQLDIEAVGRYLADHLPGFRGPLTARKFSVGQSNPTFLLESPSGRFVLRRKPPGTLLKSAHAVDREFRVQRALWDTDVPVARMHLLCEDEDVIGSMFYVMDFAPGRHFPEPTLPEIGPEERDQVFDEMNRVLAALHAVDYQAVGLGDYGKPGSYFERQIGRWTKQYRASETETITDMDALIDWLEANQPDAAQSLRRHYKHKPPHSAIVELLEYLGPEERILGVISVQPQTQQNMSWLPRK